MKKIFKTQSVAYFKHIEINKIMDGSLYTHHPITAILFHVYSYPYHFEPFQK